MFHKQKTMLYFAPHQDDELLTLGIDIITSISKGHDVHVILCTDGSKSGVRKMLNNGETCTKHEGIHNYNLSIEEFVQARDREFLGSCHSLGIQPSNIHILETRYIDGSLSVSDAESVIEKFLSVYGKDSIVCTIGPNNGPSQHRDHKALGRAAENLLNKGMIQELRLFIEPYHAKKVLTNPRLLPVYPTIQKAAAAKEKNIQNAVSSYSYWNPDEQRYAVGYHSVTTEFNDFLKEMTSYYYTIKPWPSMTVFDKLDFRYKRWLKLQNHRQLYYSLSNCEQPDLDSLKLFRFQAQEQNLYRDFCQKYSVKLRDKDLQRLADGSSFWCLVSADDVMVSSGWLAYKQHFYIGETDYGFDMDKSSSGILYDFNTKPEYRGHGYYGLLLKSIVHQAKGPEDYVIYTAPDNHASSKGILKAGFHYDGTLSASDHSLKQYLRQKGFTSIFRKNQLWGLKVSK